MDPQWVWLVWLGFAVVFAVIEIFTLDLLFAMLAVGSLIGGMLPALFGWPWWLQIALAAIIALLLIFALRPPLLRRLRRNGSTIRHNVDAIAGLSGVVETPSAIDQPGTVKLENGETWTARGAAGVPLSPGDRVSVIRVIGATVEVAPSVKES